MQFGNLTTREAMESYFQQMRTVSRAELLTKLYPQQKLKSYDQQIEQDLINAFVTIIQNFNFDQKCLLVKEIMKEFSIDQTDLVRSGQIREIVIRRKIEKHLKEKLENVGERLEEQFVKNSDDEDKTFDWVSINSKFPSLRSIFQQILLEKVRLFDEELTQLSDLQIQKNDLELHYTNPTVSSQKGRSISNFSPHKTLSMTQAKTLSVRGRMKTESSAILKKRSNIKKQIDRKGFTNVLIRDHSEFTLPKWTKKQQDEFKLKMMNFRNNFNKIGQKSPIIFQFVKQFTNTVKARDNIYHKFENRQKVDITPQELKYLCSTSLFLNKTLTSSEKERLNSNIKALGKDLISKLQFNISQKIIETYKKFMKKISDLRAHYYEELTQKRKLQYSKHKKRQNKDQIVTKRKMQFQKYKSIFTNICKSEKMKVLLNPRVARWVKLFVQNLLHKSKKKRSLLKNQSIFERLNSGRNFVPILLKSKLKCPSSRVLKRQEHKGYRLFYNNNEPADRFFYDKSFERHIKNYNSIKVKNPVNYKRQLTGGPKKEKSKYIHVDISNKSIYMSSKACLKAVIMIQAKWKAIFCRKKYLAMIEDYRECEQLDFQCRRNSLKYLYPQNKRIDLKSLKERLSRVSMRNFKQFKPYEKVVRKPINLYTSFCPIKLSLNELKRKNSLNTSERLLEFGKMVEENEHVKIMKSSFVLTAKEINEIRLKQNGSIIWWAVKNSNIELTKIFLQGGGNPNSKNIQNNTCLHLAIQNGDLQLIFLLLDFGADLNIKNHKRQTPKYFATKKMLKWLGLNEVTDEISLTTQTHLLNTNDGGQSQEIRSRKITSIQ